MKKVIALLAVVGFIAIFCTSNAFANPDVAKDSATQVAENVEAAAPAAAPEVAQEAEQAPEKVTFHQMLKQRYIEGGPSWMAPILICLIVGLALVIERILYLNLATTNTKKLLSHIEESVQKGDYEGAKQICKETRGPVASIFYQGLDRIDEGLDNVEKSIIAYGGVQMSRLESNLTWIALFIALAPMLGFLGTVIGMVEAFDNIAIQNDISPNVVAGGMKIALLTTVFGLIVAIVLQVFYNYLSSKIEGLVNTMEDASISFMDILVKNKK